MTRLNSGESSYEGTFHPGQTSSRRTVEQSLQFAAALVRETLLRGRNRGDPFLGIEERDMSANKMRVGMVLLLLGAGVAGAVVWAQTGGAPATTPPAPKAPALPPPPPDQVAVTVNGQAIFEMAVYRIIMNVPAKDLDEARKDAIDFLVANVLIDQYLIQQKVAVPAEEVEKRIKQMEKEAKDESQDFAKLLKDMFLTEAELRQQLTCALRWDKFVDQQATDKALRELFDKNKSMFDGSQMQARHILISGDAEQAKAKILAVKKEIEDEATKEAADELAKLPAGSDPVKQNEVRYKALVKAFAKAASKHSACPSKEQGGDLGWFPRSGTMVEPFAAAVFALEPYQMTGPVSTEFGQHLILAIDKKQGKDVKFEEVKSVVREVYFDRLRDALVAGLKPRAQIVIMPAKK
jgi:peptidyl-prolyl cis-trans isomerase C